MCPFAECVKHGVGNIITHYVFHIRSQGVRGTRWLGLVCWGRTFLELKECIDLRAAVLWCFKQKSNLLPTKCRNVIILGNDVMASKLYPIRISFWIRVKSQWDNLTITSLSFHLHRLIICHAAEVCKISFVLLWLWVCHLENINNHCRPLPERCLLVN